MDIIPVSIVIPALCGKGRERELIKTLYLLSVKSGVYPFEVIVVYDGCSHPSHPVTFSSEVWKVRTLSTGGKKGPAFARNTGGKIGKGKWLLFLDDDVIPRSDFMVSLKNVISTSDDSVGVIGGRVYLVDRWRYGPLTSGPSTGDGGVYLTACLLVRRDVFFKTGGFNEQFRIPAFEDVEFISRAGEVTNCAFQPSLTVFHEPREVDASRLAFEGRSWAYVYMLAKKYGFVGWPAYTTKHPFISTLYYGILRLPAGRILESLKFVAINPEIALKSLLRISLSPLINAFYILKAVFVGVK